MRFAIGAMWALCMLAGQVRPAGGQSADTLYYSEVTDGQMVLTAPGGEVAITSEHDASIGFVRIAADSAHAWYEEISVAATAPMGEQRPDLASILGDLFVLRIDDRGHVHAITTPDFPASLEGISDLRYQFVDFFMPAPPSPLEVGLTWADTLVVEEDAEDGGRGNTTKITSYTVVSDTVVESTSALVIEGRGDLEVRHERPVKGQPGLTMRMILDGSEQNTFVVATDGGDLLLRLRSAELTGTMEYLGAPQPIEMGVTRTYMNTIELRGRGRQAGGGE